MPCKGTKSNGDETQAVRFHINGKEFVVSPGQTENSNPTSVLVDFIRKEAALTGTKFMCREGGCGACVVNRQVQDPKTGEVITAAVNSCLVPVLSCDGWNISTVEGLGNQKEGYDIIQKRLVGFSGTQCGYCTPGMVMNMNSLIKSNPKLTSQEIEDAFDGNICRCTGFRPILDAFKSLAVDASETIKSKCVEFEETTGKICPLKGACCKAGKCLNGDIEDCVRSVDIKLGSNGERWVRPTSLKETLALLGTLVTQRVNYRIVAGNTSTGVYKDQGIFPVYVDINALKELKEYNAGGKTITIGAGTTLASAIELLKKVGTLPGFEYGVDLAKHWHRIANTPVRNIATLAGNLMIKHAHNEFPSDIFITLEGLGAKVNIATAKKSNTSLSLVEFLKFDMTGALIASIQLPSLAKAEGYVMRTYKITKRYQNAHAYVNSSIVFCVDSNFNVKAKPNICFGGINSTFAHANATETFFTGKSLKDSKVVEEGLKLLENELNPDLKPPDASPEYRKQLARNLLYKTILGIIGSSASNKRLTSGGGNLERNLSKGQQSYDTRKEQWPLTKPIPKLEATAQCSGEAEYINDIHPFPGELFGAFLLSTVGPANLKSMDASQALKLPGVVSFVTGNDIPGSNNYLFAMPMPIPGDQPIFAKDRVLCSGQALGLILADTREVAFEAVKLVKVHYENIKKPVIKLKDAVERAKGNGTFDASFLPAMKSSVEPNSNAIKHKIRGEIMMNGQVHFQMEPQVALVVPKEDGILDVYSATQYMQQVQACIAGMLMINNNCVNVQVRRLGGAFGAKASPATQIAAAAALGAFVTNRPVRVALDIETQMIMIGKRTPYWCEYEVGFDENGRIQSLNSKIVADNGSLLNEPDIFVALVLLQNSYDASGWTIAGGMTITDTIPNTYCRGPGSVNGVAAIETIMDHIAHSLKKDPIEVRLANLLKDGGEVLGIPGIFPNETFHGENTIVKMVDQIKSTANYEERKQAVAKFNKEHRWRKRGLGICPMRYPQHQFMISYPSFLAVYNEDGSVVISHGGIEMGQGINTKAAQVVAYTLGIPMDKIKIRPTNNVVSANAAMTAGSQGSELIAWSLYQASLLLLEKMAPVKTKLGKDVPWEELVKACHAEGIDLRSSYLPNAKDNLKQYDIWGLNLTEVELDVLTGEFKTIRLDMIEDAGKPMSPEVDIGQVEGSLIMGLGLFTTERLHYSAETGELLTKNTWEYKPPLPKDIPEDMRVTLLDNPNCPVGIHGSKATGEPPLCTSFAVVLALKQAIYSAREDAGNYDHFNVETPVTPESIVQYCLTSRNDLKI